MSNATVIINLINSYLILVSSAVLTTIGLIGNFIVIYILTWKNFLKEPFFRYFLVQEVLNIISLIIMWIWYLPLYLKWNTSSIFCKSIEYAGYVIYSIYPWISVINSVDRLLAFKYPTDFLFRKKFKYQASAVSFIFIISILSNVPTYLYFEKRNSTICGISSNFTKLYIYSAYIIFVDIIPLILMMMSTVIIVRVLIRSKKRLNVSESRTRELNREKLFFKSVLIMDMWLFICFAPFHILDLVEAKLRIDTPNFLAKYFYWNLLHNIGFLFIIIQTSCSLFVLLMCNKLFKAKFFELFCCCIKSDCKQASRTR